MDEVLTPLLHSPVVFLVVAALLFITAVVFDILASGFRMLAVVAVLSYLVTLAPHIL